MALVGESGSGKSVTALSILQAAALSGGASSVGQHRFQGPRPVAAAASATCGEVRGNDITIVFQEPMTSLNPLHTIEKQIGEILLLHRGLTGAPARARTHRTPHPGRHPRPAKTA